MLQDKIIILLFATYPGGVLNLDTQVPVRSSNGNTEMTTIHNVLVDKYLLGTPLNLSTLLDTSPGTVTSIIKVVADAIPLALLRNTGADGPSSFNTISWHCLIMQLFFNQLLLHYGLS